MRQDRGGESACGHYGESVHGLQKWLCSSVLSGICQFEAWCEVPVIFCLIILIGYLDMSISLIMGDKKNMFDFVLFIILVFCYING